jgi:hypothetical protein
MMQNHPFKVICDKDYSTHLAIIQAFTAKITDKILANGGNFEFFV